MGDLMDVGWPEEPIRFTRTGPPCEAVPVEELEKLRRALKALGDVYDMAFEAFERGRIFEPTDVPMIALAAKIVQQAGWGLGK